MRYVVAGYIVILSLLFLYAVALVWRRRRLSRTVDRVVGTDRPPTQPIPSVASGGSGLSGVAGGAP